MGSSGKVAALLSGIWRLHVGAGRHLARYGFEGGKDYTLAVFVFSFLRRLGCKLQAILVFGSGCWFLRGYLSAYGLSLVVLLLTQIAF